MMDEMEKLTHPTDPVRVSCKPTLTFKQNKLALPSGALPLSNALARQYIDTNLANFGEHNA